MALAVQIAFIIRETSASLSQFLSFFRRSTNKRELTGVVTDESPATAAATAYSVSKLSPYFVSLTPHLQCHKEGKLFIDCKRSDLKLYNCSSV